MKLRFARRAAQDLADIADYIRTENPKAAVRVRSEILKAIEALVRFPRLGRRQSVGGVRKLITRRYGYLIYYTADEAGGQIVILAIRHPGRTSPDLAGGHD